MACLLVTLPHGTMGLSVIRDYVISWSFSFSVCKIRKAFDTILCCNAQAPSLLYLKGRGMYSEKVSEYDQEVPQSQTAAQPTAP